MSIKGLNEKLEEQRRRDDEKRRRHSEEMDRKYKALENLKHTKDPVEKAIYESILHQ